MDSETVKHIAELCRIECDEAQAEALAADLKKIVAYVEQLQEVDTEGVKPCNSVLEGMASPMREDVVGETLDRDTFLKNSPSHVGGMIRVPPVIHA